MAAFPLEEIHSYARRSAEGVNGFGEFLEGLNGLAVNKYVTIPLVDRHSTDGKVTTLQGRKLSPTDDLSWNIADWTRTSS